MMKSEPRCIEIKTRNFKRMQKQISRIYRWLKLEVKWSGSFTSEYYKGYKIYNKQGNFVFVFAEINK